MDIQRLRNLTTGILHTSVSCVYEDIEYLTGAEGIMTHHLPAALRAIKPILEKRGLPKYLFEEVYLPNEVGNLDVPPLNKAELTTFWAKF
jgi:hypothetical protein